MQPLACGSFGSFTTVTYNSFSPSLNATLVVPSPAAISNTCRSLPSGDIFKIFPPNRGNYIENAASIFAAGHDLVGQLLEAGIAAERVEHWVAADEREAVAIALLVAF